MSGSKLCAARRKAYLATGRPTNTSIWHTFLQTCGAYTSAKTWGIPLSRRSAFWPSAGPQAPVLGIYFRFNWKINVYRPEGDPLAPRKGITRRPGRGSPFPPNDDHPAPGRAITPPTGGQMSARLEGKRPPTGRQTSARLEGKRLPTGGQTPARLEGKRPPTGRQTPARLEGKRPRHGTLTGI